MRLEKHIFLSIQSSVSHNIAQNLIQKPCYDYFEYLNEVAKYFYDLGVDEDQIHDIIVYGHNHGPTEVETLHQMARSYGIKTMTASGHGGSQVSPQVLFPPETLGIK